MNEGSLVMPYKMVNVEKADGIAVVTLNHPESVMPSTRR